MLAATLRRDHGQNAGKSQEDPCEWGDSRDGGARTG